MKSGKQRLISIVLPVYNGERYLRESIESVLGQTVEDWELIVVDDCSTDDSLAIAQAYAAKDARIRVLHNEKNSKLPHSLNVGFREARGEYLTWTSDDNRYLPQALEKMRAYLAACPDVPIVSARAYAIDADGTRFQGAPFPDGLIPPSDGERLFCANSMGACFLYRRAVAETVGEYDTSLFGCEDYDYWLRILEQTPRLGTLPDVLYEYRWHAQSLTQTKSAMIWERLYALREKHWKYITHGLSSQPQCAVQIFLEMSRVRRLPQEMWENLLRAMPALRGFVPLAPEGRFLVYGAGQCGRAFAAAHASAVCCFADRSEAMWGKDIDGVPVLSLPTARAAYPKAQVVLAGDVPVAGSMMESLWAQGVRAFAYCEPLYL